MPTNSSGKKIKGGEGIYGPDTTVAGVTSAQIRPAMGKGDTAVDVPQVDIAQALNFFTQAADVQTKQNKMGLNFYTDSLKTAATQIKVGYANANNTLSPLALSARNALNEEMRMMGLDPISSTATAASEAAKLGYSADIQAKLDRAEKLRNPVQRAQAKQEILLDLQNNINIPITPSDDTTDIGKVANQGQQEQQNQLRAQFASNYDLTYSNEYDDGYTGDEVIGKLEATPGYQFALDQGTKAIERQGAAAGMLGSGNTLYALQDYGQGLAQSTYGAYMSNLSNIVAQGSGAIAQISANQAAEGGANADLSMALAQTGNQSAMLTGQAQAEALNNKARAFQEAAQFNAQMQYAGIQAPQNRQAALAQSAMAATPGIMNAQTAQAQQQYGFQQAAQASRQYFGNTYV